jgi:hypothetical protein
MIFEEENEVIVGQLKFFRTNRGIFLKYQPYDDLGLHYDTQYTLFTNNTS